MSKCRTEVLPSFWKYSTHPNTATCEAADAVCTFTPPPKAGTALSWALPPGGRGRPQRWWLADKATTQSPLLLRNATQTLFGSLTVTSHRPCFPVRTCSNNKTHSVAESCESCKGPESSPSPPALPRSGSSGHGRKDALGSNPGQSSRWPWISSAGLRSFGRLPRVVAGTYVRSDHHAVCSTAATSHGRPQRGTSLPSNLGETGNVGYVGSPMGADCPAKQDCGKAGGSGG